MGALQHSAVRSAFRSRRNNGPGRSTGSSAPGAATSEASDVDVQPGQLAPTFCLGNCTRRKLSPYVPQLSPGLRYIYDASCFGWWIVVLGLLWRGELRSRPYGVPMAFTLTLQSFFSFMGDSHEFLSTGVPGGPWGCADQLWAISSILVSLLFVGSNDIPPHGVAAYAGSLLCGTVCWTAGVITLRTEGGSATLWACCHIGWHVFLCIGGLVAALSLE